MGAGGSNDLGFIAIILILALTYGTFLFMYSSENTEPGQPYNSMASENYTAPSSSGFWSSLSNVVSLNTSSPELFFINTIVFGTIGTLTVLVGLRFLRGQG